MTLRPINYDHRIERAELLPEITEWLSTNAGVKNVDWSIIIFEDKKKCTQSWYRIGDVIAVAIVDPDISAMFRLVYGHEIGNSKLNLLNQ